MRGLVSLLELGEGELMVSDGGGLTEHVHQGEHDSLEEYAHLADLAIALR